MDSIAGIPIWTVLRASAHGDAEGNNERARVFLTRDYEIGVVYFDETGQIIGLWFDFTL